MTRYYWVKFDDHLPERWAYQSFEEFWHRVRERIIQRSVRLEWIIEE